MGQIKIATYILIAAFLLWNAGLQAQTTDPDWEDTYQTLEDAGEAESENWQLSYDELSEFAENKIDINSASDEDLLRLPFLSGQQVMDIREYLYRYGPMKSASEFMMIPSIDYNTRQLLLLCTYIGQETEKKRFPSPDYLSKYGHNEIVATGHIPLNEREGDKWGYLGYQYKHWIRYQYTCGKWVKAGIVASQDAGEPFFAGRNKWGYDYVSPYVLVRNLGAIKTIALGRYRARFGLGLVMNNSFSMGKQGALASLGRTSRGLFAHSSRMEANYMQGGGITVGLSKNIDITAFASYRKIDATLNDGDNSITTILRTGYHRTASEMLRRRNARQTVMGGNVNYRSGGFHFGATGYYTSFDKPLHPDTSRIYRRIAPWGQQFWNIGADYGYISRRLTVSGEVATCDNGGMATINTVSAMLSSRISVVAIQRFYSYKYHSLMGSSFSENGSVQNESGIYLGANTKLSRRLSTSHYADYAYSPWPRYLATGSTRTFDTQHSATWTKGNTSITARYRLKTWNHDNSATHNMERLTRHRLRLSYTSNGPLLYLRTQADASVYDNGTTSCGMMIGQQAGIKLSKWKIYANAAYFNTENYDARVYAYERSTLYTLSFPMLYGHGIRGSLVCRADISSSLMIIGKIGTTHYFDRDKIGSGLQEIDSSTVTDIDLQLRWKF